MLCDGEFLRRKKEVKTHMNISYNRNFNFYGYDLSCQMLTTASSGGGNSSFAFTMTKRFRAGKGAFDETTLLC